MGRIVEGVWNCKSCGTKGIGASNKKCPNCGAPMSTYSLPSGMQSNIGKTVQQAKGSYVNNVTAQKVKRTPQNWICSYCDCHNDGNNTTCINCGASRDKNSKTYLEYKEEFRRKEEACQKEIRERKEQSKFNQSLLDELNGVPSLFDRLKENIASTIGWTIALGALTGFIIFFIIFFAKLLVGTEEHLVTVTSFGWERSVVVNEIKTVRESNWDLPFDAKLISTEDKLYDYKDVLDHYDTKEVTKSKDVIVRYKDVVVGYKDLGNGFYEELTEPRPVYEKVYYTEKEKTPVYRKEPIYKTWYTYTLEKEVYVRTINASNEDKEPYWPDVLLFDHEVRGHESQQYYVKAVNNNDVTEVLVLSYNDWLSYEIGDVLSYETNLLGVKVSTPKKVDKQDRSEIN